MFRKKIDPAQSLPVEWLVVGLGNPGPEYKGTRHNVGFDVVERLGQSEGIKLQTGRSRAVVGKGLIGASCVMLVKPLTFMNLSGQSVAPLARGQGVPPNRILVVSDDLDLPPGRIRLREGGGAGGHNGHKSISASLGTQDYPRLRVGIGRPGDETIDHVLSRFDPEERAIVDAAVRVASAMIEEVIGGDWHAALARQDQWNKSL